MTIEIRYDLHKRIQICSICKHIYDTAEHESCPECRERSIRDTRNLKNAEALGQIYSILHGNTWTSGACGHIAEVLQTVGLHPSPFDLDDDQDDIECFAGIEFATVKCSHCGMTAIDSDTGICQNCGTDDMATDLTPEAAEYYRVSRGGKKASGNEISRDDQNRRLRERRLGYAEPSEDWAEAGTPVICIHRPQMPSKAFGERIKQAGFVKCHVHWLDSTYHVVD